jgi:multidrug efflux pump
VSDIADTVLKERIQTIPGVSGVRIFGEKRYAMRLWLDPGEDGRPRRHSRRRSEGAVDSPERRSSLRPASRAPPPSSRCAPTAASHPEDFNNLIVKQDGGRQILLRDIGHAELGREPPHRQRQPIGIPMIGIAVIPQPNTNAIAIADEFFRRSSRSGRNSRRCETEIGYDFTRFVRKSIGEVRGNPRHRLRLVALIIFLFLRDWRSTLIPVIAIPISIISAFFIMYVAGYSINVLTLVALVLAIGLVCDDAIVVLENIYSKIEEGMTPLQAAFKGSKEIYFAVISTTVTLAAVFVPIDLPIRV